MTLWAEAIGDGGELERYACEPGRKRPRYRVVEHGSTKWRAEVFTASAWRPVNRVVAPARRGRREQWRTHVFTKPEGAMRFVERKIVEQAAAMAEWESKRDAWRALQRQSKAGDP